MRERRSWLAMVHRHPDGAAERLQADGGSRHLLLRLPLRKISKTTLANAGRTLVIQSVG